MEPKTFTLRRRTTRTRFLYPASATLLLLFVFLTLRPVAIKKETASAAIDNSTYALSLTTNPEVNLQITPTANGTLSIAKDTIIANTASPAGYKLYVSTDSNSNDITIDDNTLEESQSSKFLATTGTQTSPIALENNTWGYAIPGLASFDTSYNATNPSNTSKFAALPALGNEALIKDHTGTATNEQTEVYYAAKADMNMTAGNYKATIMYTTLSDASSEVTGEATITPSKLDNGYTATELTIATSLVTSRNLGTISAMVGSTSCENIELVTNNPVTITCTIPANLTSGKYNVTLNIPTIGKTYTITNGFEVSPQVTANVASSSASYGTISNNGFIAPYGTPITTNGNTITIGNQTITATPTAQTAQYDYTFANWTNNCGTTVTANCTISANFTRTARSYTVTFVAGPSGYGTVSRSSQTVTYGGAVSTSGSTVTVAGTATTATAASQTAQYAYAFANWTNNCGTTVTANCTITANFTRSLRYYDVTVNFAGSGVNKVVFAASGYDTRTITASGAKASLAYGVSYTMTISFNSGYEFSSWTKTAGTIGSTSSNPTTFVANSTATITATGKASCTGIMSNGTCTIPYMQDIASLKSSLVQEQQYQFKDQRDNKVYWVSKLKDGNVWMTQNLDYDIKADSNIISNNNGTTSTWTSSSAYAPRATTTSIFNNTSETGTYSYNPGDYYMPNGTGDSMSIASLTSSSIIGNTNAHYHLGNYYQGYAATAGGTEEASICPKGWRLPLSGYNSNCMDNYSFCKLTSTYGITDSMSGIGYVGDTKLLIAPLFFARTGGIMDGALNYKGGIGLYWSSFPGYNLYFDSSYAISGNSNHTYHGFSVRCVAI